MPGYVKMGTQPTLPTGGLPSLVLSPCVLKPRGSWEMRPVWPLPPPMGHVPSASAGQLPALTWAADGDCSHEIKRHYMQSTS